MINTDIIKRSIDHYGPTLQSVVVMEECAELTQVISKALRGKVDITHMAEELADVLICCEMLANIYGINATDIDRFIEQKQERMTQRMNADEQGDAYKGTTF